MSFVKLGRKRRKSDVRISSVMVFFHDGKTIALGQSLNGH